MRDTCDFPAAHSMDTIWFAIDAEGNLGIFDSGENGPVPVEFNEQEIGYRVQDIVQEEVMAGRLPLDLSVIKEKSEEPHVGVSVFVNQGWPAEIGVDQDNIVAEVSSWEALQALGLSATLHRLQSTNNSVLVGFDKLTNEDWVSLHSKDVCIFCCNLDLYFDRSAACGLYHYEGDTSWYQLEHRPMKPVKLADVEDKLPAELLLVHLPFKFAEQTHFQPLITMECNTWGDTPCYSLPGTTTREQIKPIPGKEAEYRKWYEEEYLPHKDDWYQDVAVEEPK